MNADNASLIADEFAFNEMRAHVLHMYQGVNVTNSFFYHDHFDCITVESQPSLRRPGVKLAAPPRALPPADVSKDSGVLLSPLRPDAFDTAGNIIWCRPGDCLSHPKTKTPGRS